MMIPLLKHLDRTHFDARVCVLQDRDGNPIADEISRLGILVDNLPVNRLRDPTALPRMIRYLKRSRTHLVHTQLEFSDILGNAAAWILRRPSVSTIHTMALPVSQTRPYYRQKLQWLSQEWFCDRIISVSECARRHYLSKSGVRNSKVTTIHNGIDLSPYRAKSRNEYRSIRQMLGIAHDALVVITIAVLREQKGIQFLIQAAPLIIETVPKAHFLIVGAGDHLEPLMRQSASIGVGGQVRFLGQRNDIPDILSIADVFVLPTLTEALPTVLAEAMAAEIPIIASAVGGVPEMVTDSVNGLLIPPKNPTELARSCINLLSAPEKRHAMGAAGREAVSTRFSISKQVQQLEQLYRELFDEMCSKEGGRTGAQQIVSDPKFVAVFGTTCSGAAAPAMKILSQAGYAMISGANTAPSLTSVNGEKGPDHFAGYFRTSHNDEIQGQAAAVFAYQVLGFKKAATIHDGDAYTKGLVQIFQREFKQLGGKIVISAAVNKGDTNMRPVLSAVAESGAELIFFPLFQPEGDYIVKQAGKIPSFKSIALMGADGLLQKSFLESVADDGRGMYFIGPAKPEGAKYNHFVDQYVEKSKEHPIGPLHTHGYDAANVLMNAIERSAIRDQDNTLHIGRHALRQALQATSGYHGLTGDINCNQFGDCSSPKINIVRLDNPESGFEGLRGNVQYTFVTRKDN